VLKQIEGSRAVAEAVAMSRPDVICAYPITPQTHIVEALGAMVKKGELNAEFLNVESEFAAMSVAIGASAAGARSNTLTCGHRACQGCGEALGARFALDAVMRATKGKMIAVNATGCLEVFSTPFPETSRQIPWLHSLFGDAPAVASGVAAALKAQSGLFPVFEAETGQVVSPIRHQDPVTDYLRLQARYTHLFRPTERTETIARLQAAADRNITRFNLSPERAALRAPVTADTSGGQRP
jgi:hypothetical protein